MKRRVSRHLLPFEGDWWGWAGNQRTIGRYFRIDGGTTVELRWGVESGPITVEYYDGDTKRKVDAERSEKGMIDALKLVGRQIGVWGRLVYFLKGKWHNGSTGA